MTLPSSNLTRIAAFALLLLVFGCKTPDHEITFASDREETLDLFGMTADSSFFRQYTGDDGTEYNPDWSPDGLVLAYTRWRGSNADIFAFSPARGSIETLVGSPAYDADPDWSPDGLSVLFVSDRDGFRGVYQALLADSLVLRLSPTDETDNAPEFSPDGRRIAFSRSLKDGSGRSAIMTMDADGSNVVQLSTAAGLDALATWSPDSRRLAFQRCAEDRCSLWLIDADGLNEKPLLENEHDHRSPAWSPDGDFISFTSKRGGAATDIYVISPEGTDEQRVTRWPGVDEGATWNPVVVPGRDRLGSPE